MTDQSRVLLVEGENDRAFLEALCVKLDIYARVRVAPPKEVGGCHNSKQGVLNHLKNVMLPQLRDGQLTSLGIVVDADSPPNGGVGDTIALVERIVQMEGYSAPTSEVGGLIFPHEDGLPDFGLWVMPDNMRNGMLEDLVSDAVGADEQELFNHARTVVDSLPEPRRFKPLHQSKAHVATWMAWQRSPGHGLYRAMEDDLLDLQAPGMVKLTAWMRHLFA